MITGGGFCGYTIWVPAIKMIANKKAISKGLKVMNDFIRMGFIDS